MLSRSAPVPTQHSGALTLTPGTPTLFCDTEGPILFFYKLGKDRWLEPSS
jgi:hypothetical protein